MPDRSTDITEARFPEIATWGHPGASNACGDKLGQLRRVTSRQVGRIDETDIVHLVPLCDTVGHTLTETETQYLARGNISGLLTTIGNNPVLMAELTDGGYKANDVLGIALGPNAAILYVHKQ